MAYTKLKHFIFAKGTYTDGSAPTYSGAVKVGNLMNVNLTLDHADAKLYGDDMLVASDMSITGGSMTMGVTHLTDAVRSAMLGEVVGADSEDGVYAITDNNPGYGGSGFVRGGVNDNGVAVYTGYIVPKTVWALNGENGTTRGESTEFQTPELSGTIMGHHYDSTGTARYILHKDCTTEAEAIAWVNGVLGYNE